MSTLGKVCLVLTILLLLITIAPIPTPYGGWAPSLLVIHNQWATRLRDAEAKNLQDLEAHNKAKIELQEVAAELGRLQLGWDRVWEIGAPGSNTGINVQQNGFRMAVNGIGFENGLVARQIDDGSGQPKVVPPVVHVFRAMPESGFTYVGEYVADVTQLGANSAVLEATRTPTPGEPQPWQQSQGIWRLRTMIPAAPRSSMDELHRRITRVFDLYRETVANIQQQQANLEAARTQLDIRKAELLGNPAAEPIPGRPEFTDGLLKTIDDEETLRNDLQYDVDQLRRQIGELADERDRLLEELNQLLDELPESNSDPAQLTRLGRTVGN